MNIMENDFNNKKVNNSLNFLKCLAIFAIICIHCGFYETGLTGVIIDALSRFAVPVFFFWFF